jgi:hypothetical protein
MNFRRLLLGSLFVLLPSAALLAQEAVEPRVTPAEEAPVVETTPQVETRPQVETAAPEIEATPIPGTEEEKPKRSKVKEKAPTEESHARTEESQVRDIQDSMTAEQFKAAGLDKLSQEELNSLNRWLQGYRQKAETKAAEVATAEATKKAASESRTRMDVILSRVDDENFTGVTGRSIIKLEDGTVWKQTNMDDHFHAQVTNRPPARVNHGTFGYKMHIVGVPEFYVDPVRSK